MQSNLFSRRVSQDKIMRRYKFRGLFRKMFKLSNQLRRSNSLKGRVLPNILLAKFIGHTHGYRMNNYGTATSRQRVYKTQDSNLEQGLDNYEQSRKKNRTERNSPKETANICCTDIQN